MTRPLFASFDRFDVCEAYAALEADFNEGGVLWRRPSCARRMESCGMQLARIGFRAGAARHGFAALTRNGRAIYLNASRRLGYRRTA